MHSLPHCLDHNGMGLLVVEMAADCSFEWENKPQTKWNELGAALSLLLFQELKIFNLVSCEHQCSKASCINVGMTLMVLTLKAVGFVVSCLQLLALEKVLKRSCWMQLPHTAMGSVGGNSRLVYSCSIRVWTKAGSAAAPAAVEPITWKFCWAPYGKKTGWAEVCSWPPVSLLAEPVAPRNDRASRGRCPTSI